MRRWLLALFLAAACGKVSSGSDAGDSDHRGDGGSGGVVADAAPVDAAPVACDGPEDCANPDDPCLLPGTCGDDSVCHFEAMDCGDLDGECTKGICQDGECHAKSIRQGLVCGAGTACGDFGDCGNFADTCDESGTQSRSCTDSTCQAGACTTGAAYDDSRNCGRDQTGVTCSDTTVTCDPCDYGTECARDATPVNCVQTDYTCSGGGCGSSQTGFQDDSCHRDTEGASCGDGGCCTPAGACAPSCV